MTKTTTMTKNNKKQQCFEKVACFTDIHFGLKNNSELHNKDCTNFINWFCKEAKNRKAETCIFTGDWHHYRNNINVSTLNYTAKNLKTLSKTFDTVYLILGNHDIFYRHNREIHSMCIAENLKNVKIIDKPTSMGDTLLVPWLINDEWKEIRNCKEKYIFGHFELPGFMLNSMVKMPEHKKLHYEDFQPDSYVFSGHFHKRQNKGNVHYIGNPFGHNFADSWDFEKGAMFLERGKKPEFVNWSEGPKYITISLNEFFNRITELPLNNTYLKIDLVNINQYSFNDLEYIKNTAKTAFGIRDIKFVNSSEDYSYLNNETVDLNVKPIDSIVADEIMGIESNSYDKNLILKMYNNL